jgi:hypothetical protein
VPSTVIAADKLPNISIALDVKMRGYLKAFNRFEVGVQFPVQLIGKQQLHFVSAVDPRGQADGMEYYEVDVRPQWTRPKVWRR